MKNNPLPLILAGPILRRVLADRITLWIVSSRPIEMRLTLSQAAAAGEDISTPIIVNSDQLKQASKCVPVSGSCFFYLIDLPLSTSLPYDRWIAYDLSIAETPNQWLSISEWGSDLNYPGKSTPGFVIHSKLQQVLHGSCRKPHHASADGLTRADKLYASQISTPEELPSLLVMSGDQIYADDVAGPLLNAIHQLTHQLNFPDECFTSDDINSTCELHQDTPNYYTRENILPKTHSGQLYDVLFGGVRKPVFTSVNAQNHLISLGEIIAMYLLVWSPTVWESISLDAPDSLPSSFLKRYEEEKAHIEKFREDLSGVRRILAHLPTAMIFDDHDITDDWNLTAGWEQAAYGHPLSKRIIGNALVGYLLCQGWGNAPEKFSDSLVNQMIETCQNPGSATHDLFIDNLLKFSHWHYEWPTTPRLVVLDTRTHRWRSERGLNRPSGLMDWEAFSDLQQSLMGLDSVILVSPAPMFGVKFIENVQRFFTWMGMPLMVDAENWMAHNGAANTLINMFRHSKTPQTFIILSGDVHYSFVYHVKLRGRRNSPDIWQITSSGLRNEFPFKLLRVFDRLNRWLYAPWSPLNWITKRRRMRIIPHRPEGAAPGERLINQSGIGLLKLDNDNKPEKVIELCANGNNIEFQMEENEGRWE